MRSLHRRLFCMTAKFRDTHYLSRRDSYPDPATYVSRIVWVYGLNRGNSTNLSSGDALRLIAGHCFDVLHACFLSGRTVTAHVRQA